MTFRPSDDVLDEIANGQQTPSSLNQYNVGDQGEGSHLFHSENDANSEIPNTNETENPIIDIPVEEVKAPDLSELLKNNGGDNVDNINNSSSVQEEIESKISPESQNIEVTSTVETSPNIETNETVNNTENNEISQKESQIVNNSYENNQSENTNQNQMNESDYIDSDKLPDIERTKLVSSIDGSINSNLDFLVDKEWFSIIEKYKRVNRLFFRWGAFLLALILGIIGGAVLEVKASSPENLKMINDESIENKFRWNDDTTDKKFSPLIDSGVEINVIIPYGSASINGSKFQSKSNLISYKGIILPQLSSINYNYNNLISIEDFDNQKIGRKDLENLIDILIKDNSIYKDTSNLPNISDSRWIGNLFEGKLVDGFNLSCLENDKLSDFVCDNFIDTFYKYGKYYQLSSNSIDGYNYSSEILDITKKLNYNFKNVEPVCKMVNDYILHAGVSSENLNSLISNYCSPDDNIYYKKLTNFIELENSLGQPELSDKVFDDPDLNAYKLLSAQQSVYKFLGGTSFNENYIKSYLNFIEKLINKDKGKNKYISPIYKDLLYVFNSDELYPFLIEKSYTNLKLQIDQINNGNVLNGYESLIKQLSTTGLVKLDTGFTTIEIEERTLEDLFSKYYAMTDRLKIRRATPISDNKISVQTELFTDKILSITEDETLKLTLVLRRKNNLLYVDSIKVANQPKFSEILNIYVSGGNIGFSEILSYIEEQVGMRYELEPENQEVQPTFCEQIQEREDIAIYTCNDSSISLYKGEIEYNFTLTNGILDSYSISDEKLDKLVKEKLKGVMFMKDNTQTIITSIIDFEGNFGDDNLQKKIDIIDQFRIHFKLIPDDIHDIKGNSNEFLIDLTLGEIKLQAKYNINTHTLTNISYASCDRLLEIRGLAIPITSENEPQLIEILNNPKVFLIKTNQAAYKKYQKMCEEDKEKAKEEATKKK